jgi:hypothetical protein
LFACAGCPFGTAHLAAILARGDETMRLANTLIGLIFCATSFGVCGEPGTKKTGLTQREQSIPALAGTSEIHVGVNANGSGNPYIVIRPSGQLFFVPFQSAKEEFPEGTRSTAAGAVDFAHWHAKLSRLATLQQPMQGAHFVMFVNSKTHSGRGVYIADSHTAALQPLFEPFLKPSKTPP